MTSLQQSGSIRNAAEGVLHFAELTAIAAEGDKEFDSPAQWDDNLDNWFYGVPEDIRQPYDQADLDWWARESLTEAEEQERVARTLAECDEDPEYREERLRSFMDEFHSWVELLDASYEQQERGRDCGFGHQP